MLYKFNCCYSIMLLINLWKLFSINSRNYSVASNNPRGIRISVLTNERADIILHWPIRMHKQKAWTRLNLKVPHLLIAKCLMRFFEIIWNWIYSTGWGMDIFRKNLIFSDPSYRRRVTFHLLLGSWFWLVHMINLV